MFTISNKIALVTGAAQGIGLDYAKALLRRNLKAVALIDIDEVKGRKALDEVETEFGKNRAIFIKADVANKSQFEDAFEVTVQTFKQLDIVVNNAGIVQEIEWEKCISVNLVGTMVGSNLAMEKYLPRYRQADEGVILNISSTSGIQAFEAFPAYTASKHGIIGFSRSIGGPVHYKINKVRVLTICPDATVTSLCQISKEQLPEPYLSMYQEAAKVISYQGSHEVAEHAMKIIESGPSGSVWLISKNTCTEVKFES